MNEMPVQSLQIPGMDGGKISDGTQSLPARLHYFIGFGMVEAGCKSVVDQRLKQSGMRWSVEGARQILNFRCALASGLFDLLWEACQPSTSKKIIASNPLLQICLN